MRPSINPHVLNLKASATLAINQRVMQLRANGEEVYHFGFGQSPFPVPRAIQAALIDHADKNTYLPTRGLPELCEAITVFYDEQCGCSVSPDQVVVGPGSKELIFQVLYLLQGPLLIPAPSWVSYGPQATLRGKEIVTIETRRKLGYRLQADELDQACRASVDSQKILIFNNPNNPSGSSHSEQEIKDLAAACKTHQIIVISDEIYGLVNFRKEKHTSIAHHYPEGTIITGGLSKAFSAGGYRLGVMIIPPELENILQALESMISETFSAVSAPVQYAALAAYRYSDEVREGVERCTDIHRFAGEYLHQRFIDMNLNCPKPEGGFYLFPDFDHFREPLLARGIVTSRQLTETLLTEARVALLPGSDFYLPDTHLGVRVASVDYDGEHVLHRFPGASAMDEKQLTTLFPNLVHGCDRLNGFLARL